MHVDCMREVFHSVREVCGCAGGHAYMHGGQGWGDVCSSMEEVGHVSTIDTHLFVMPKAIHLRPKASLGISKGVERWDSCMMRMRYM